MSTDNRRRGQGLVEFALVLPVMMLILLVAVDFGRLFFTYIQVNNAAREAAFVAAQNFTNPNLNTRASQEGNVQAQGGAGNISAGTPGCATAANPPVATACPTGTPDPSYFTGSGSQVTVSVNQGFTFLTPLIGAFFSAPFSVGASATAPIMPAVATSGGGGGGATDDPCALFATFTWTQDFKNKQSANMIFDATGSTPDPSGSCSPKITKLAWTWNETDAAYAVDDPTVPPSAYDVTTTNFSAGLPTAVASGIGKNGKSSDPPFYVALTVWAGGTTSYTFRQDVYSLYK